MRSLCFKAGMVFLALSVVPHTNGSEPLKIPCELNAESLAKNASRLCVQLVIRDGRLAVDRDNSTFNLSTIFLHRLKVSRAEAETALFLQLQKLIDAIPHPYRLALSEAEK